MKPDPPIRRNKPDEWMAKLGAQDEIKESLLEWGEEQKDLSLDRAEVSQRDAVGECVHDDVW